MRPINFCIMQDPTNSKYFLEKEFFFTAFDESGRDYNNINWKAVNSLGKFDANCAYFETVEAAEAFAVNCAYFETVEAAEAFAVNLQQSEARKLSIFVKKI